MHGHAYEQESMFSYFDLSISGHGGRRKASTVASHVRSHFPETWLWLEAQAW